VSAVDMTLVEPHVDADQSAWRLRVQVDGDEPDWVLNISMTGCREWTAPELSKRPLLSGTTLKIPLNPGANGTQTLDTPIVVVGGPPAVSAWCDRMFAPNPS
jgi:hypothetical protein